MFQELNKALLISLNSLTDYDFIQIIILFFADTPIFFLPIFLLTMWVYYTYSKKTLVLSEIYLSKNLLEKENLLYITYSVIIGIIISTGIQQIIQIDRPEEALKGVGQLLLAHIPDASFPSDHATVSVAFLTGLFLAGFKKTGIYFTPFVIIMLLSRVILGVHWPFDVIAGTGVGILSAYISFKVLIKYQFMNILNQYIIKIMKYIKL